LNEMNSYLSYLDELAKMVLIRSNDPELYDAIDSKVGFYNGSLRLLKGYGVEAKPELYKFPGLELQATEEDRPGFKDYGRVMDVLETIELD